MPSSEQAEEGYPRDPKTDKQGRIIDPFNGRVLRDRRSRTFGTAPFKGKVGKPHPRTAHLKARIAAFEASKQDGRTRPGSLTK